MFRDPFAEQDNDELLIHFGVKGMKWGVRKKFHGAKASLAGKNAKAVNKEGARISKLYAKEISKQKALNETQRERSAGHTKANAQYMKEAKTDGDRKEIREHESNQKEAYGKAIAKREKKIAKIQKEKEWWDESAKGDEKHFKEVKRKAERNLERLGPKPDEKSLRERVSSMSDDDKQVAIALGTAVVAGIATYAARSYLANVAGELNRQQYSWYQPNR